MHQQRWRDEVEMLEAMCSDEEVQCGPGKNSVVVSLGGLKIEARSQKTGFEVKILSGGGEREVEIIRKILSESQGEICLLNIVQELSELVQESKDIVEEKTVSNSSVVKSPCVQNLRLRTNPSFISLRMMNFKTIVHLMSFLHRKAVRLYMTRVSRRFFRIARNGGYRHAVLSQERTQRVSVYRKITRGWDKDVFLNFVKYYNEMLAMRRGRCVTIGFSLRNFESNEIRYERLIPIHATSKFCESGGLKSHDFITKKRAKAKNFMRTMSWRVAIQLSKSAFLRRIALPLLVLCLTEDFGIDDSKEALKIVKGKMEITQVEDHRRDNESFHVHFQLLSSDIRIPSYFNYMSKRMSLGERQMICTAHGLIPCVILKEAYIFGWISNLLMKHHTCSVEYCQRVMDRMNACSGEGIRYDSYALIHAMIACKPSREIQHVMKFFQNTAGVHILSLRSVDVLLQLGHDPNTRMYHKNGATPLFLAAESFASRHDSLKLSQCLSDEEKLKRYINDLNLMTRLLNAGARVETLVEISYSKHVPAIYHFLKSKEFCLQLFDQEIFEKAVDVFFKLLPDVKWSDKTLDILMSTTLSHFKHTKSTSKASRVAWIVDALVKIGAKLPPERCPDDFLSSFWNSLHSCLAKGKSSEHMLQKVRNTRKTSVQVDPIKLRNKTQVPIESSAYEHDDFRSGRRLRRRSGSNKSSSAARRDRRRRLGLQ